MVNISVMIYSYKNQRVEEVVSNIFDTSSLGVHVTLYDQHPMDRREKFSKFKNFEYKHIFWDKITSPTSHKNEFVRIQEPESKYTMLLSDDIILMDGWDAELIDNLVPGSVISGTGAVREIDYSDKYIPKYIRGYSEIFSVSNIADRSFLFTETENFNLFSYPTDFKYHGEMEALSINIFNAGMTIVSAPSRVVSKDLDQKILETLYVPFSIEHNYNSIFGIIENDGANWAKQVGLDVSRLRKIPYQIDDVPYDPYSMEFIDVDQSRFIGLVKAIY